MGKLVTEPAEPVLTATGQTIAIPRTKFRWRGWTVSVARRRGGDGWRGHISRGNRAHARRRETATWRRQGNAGCGKDQASMRALLKRRTRMLSRDRFNLIVMQRQAEMMQRR